jgi:hypothetical protein
VAQLFSLGCKTHLIHYQTLKDMILDFIPIAFAVTCICAAIYVITLVARLVNAHERVASSLDIIARKMKDDAKP